MFSKRKNEIETEKVSVHSKLDNNNITEKHLSFDEAKTYIQEIIQDSAVVGKERADRNKQIIEASMAGDRHEKNRLMQEIENLLIEHKVKVDSYDVYKLTYEIYKANWGLDVLEELYNDPCVNEIRINRPDKIFVLKNLKNEQVDVRFESDEHVRNLILRLVMHDQGIALNRNSPTLESMRRDGTRITATCPPVTSYHTLTLRKHTEGVGDLDDYVKMRIINEKVKDLLIRLVQGRANILVSGGVGSGKTTLLRNLFRYTDSNCRTIVLETDRELKLSEHFPDRDIVEFEEHVEANGGGVKEGRTLKNLFRTILRYSPTIIIVGEFRTGDEAIEAVRACSRGHDGSMTTAHFNSCREAVRGIAQLLTEKGLIANERLAELLVASAFNVVIQMYGDPARGRIIVEQITELILGRDSAEYNVLVEWRPDSSEDYFKGDWIEVGKPSERLLSRLRKYNVTM